MKSKVLIFIDWFAPGYKAGGPITSNVNLTEHLKGIFDFYVITSSYDYHSEEPYEGIPQDKWVDRDGVNVWYFSKESLSYSNINKVAKDAHCDVWYVNGIYSKYFSIIPLFVAKSIKPKKVIVSTRGMLSPQGYSGLKKQLFICAMKMLCAYQDVEFHTTNDEESFHAQSVINNNIKVSTIENLPRRQEVQSVDDRHKQKNCIRLVSFARISNEKNTLFAVRSLSYCKQNVQYDIFGQINSKDYWNECLSVINHLPTNIIVKYKGVVNPKEMSALYKNYDMMYLPTCGENFGHAILESFTNGCPVIISDKTPWRDLMSKGIGWDLPLNEESFAKVIDEAALMNDEEYHMLCENAIVFAKSVMDREDVKNKYIQLFTI